MNKSLFKFFFVLIFLSLLLTACGDVKLEIKKNGSGTVQVEVPGGLISKSDVEEQLNEMYGGADGISKIKVRERKNLITAEFKFDAIENLEAGAYSKEMSEVIQEEANVSDRLNFVKKPVKFNKNSKEVYVRLPLDLNDFDKVQVTLPGRVIAHSENLELTKSNIVEYKSSAESYLVYKPGGSPLKSIFTVLIILALAGGVLMFLQTNKGKNEEEKQTEDIS